MKGSVNIFAVVSLLLLGIGAAVVWFGWKNMEQARASEEWESVMGRVTQAEVVRSTDDNGNNIYSPRVVYDYKVNGQLWSSDRRNFDLLTVTDRDQSKAEEILRKYPLGSEVRVYYEPGLPYNATLETGPTLVSWIVLGIGAFMALIAAPFMAIGAMIHGRKR